MEFTGAGNNPLGSIEVHIGSPDGTMIGKASGTGGKGNATAQISATSGRHNVYFVFGEAEAKIKAISMVNK